MLQVRSDGAARNHQFLLNANGRTAFREQDQDLRFTRSEPAIAREFRATLLEGGALRLRRLARRQSAFGAIRFFG